MRRIKVDSLIVVVLLLAIDAAPAAALSGSLGIHDPSGKKVGRVSHVRNVEYVVLAGAPDLVEGLCRSQAMSRS